jgi:glycosyltransferase involved in cell wall biosynthesis
MLSLVIPVYRNEENLPRLLRELGQFAQQLPDELEVVLVVDGSPDDKDDLELRVCRRGHTIRGPVTTVHRGQGEEEDGKILERAPHAAR